jgi:hypothetical protein
LKRWYELLVPGGMLAFAIRRSSSLLARKDEASEREAP